MIKTVSKPFKWFFQLEAASGLVLLIAAIIALIISNSGFSEIYFSTLEQYLFIGINDLGLKLSVHHWINDLLMAIFFFFVTLEIKREFIQGELSNLKKALLPIIGAVGGMVIPALVYIGINFGNSETMNGWAIPSATDIAFSLGILSLLGSRVPVSLKIFLTALAIIDDLGAILIIAFFYSGDLSISYLSLILISYIFLLILNKFGVRKFLPYLIIGAFMWFFTYKSGIHATIAGVLLASTIPHRTKDKDFSLLIKLEHAISPYVAFMIMPIFAFANAGVSLEGLSLSSLLLPVPLGILLGLFIGKQVGVMIFSYIAVKIGVAQMPDNSSWFSLYGVSVLTGIGFTMSLFVGNLAFLNDTQYIDGVKIGVLSGSLFSTLVGYFMLLIVTKKSTNAN
jgi:NhaA family Na+:H+ antiporter